MQIKHDTQDVLFAEELPSFYILQDDNGLIIGLSQVKKEGKNLSVQFIESIRDNKYKYVGQVMLAALGLDIIQQQGDKLIITSPTENAKPFYIDKCGFKTRYDGNLKMNSKHLHRFIRQTQKKTQAPLIDIRV